MNPPPPTPRVGTLDRDEPTGHGTSVAPTRGIASAGHCFTVPGVDPIIEELICRIRPPELVWLIADAATPANAYELTRRVYEVAGSWPALVGGDPRGPLAGYGCAVPEHQRKRLHPDEPSPEARAAIFCHTEPLERISDLDVLVKFAARGRDPQHLAVGIQAPMPPQASGVHFDLKDPRMWITNARETVQQLRSSFGQTASVEVRPARRSRLRPATTHWLLLWLELSFDWVPVALV